MSTREPVFRPDQPVCFDGTQATPLSGSRALPTTHRWLPGMIVHVGGDTLDVMLSEPMSGHSGPPVRYSSPSSAATPRQPDAGCPND